MLPVQDAPVSVLNENQSINLDIVGHQSTFSKKQSTAGAKGKTYLFQLLHMFLNLPKNTWVLLEKIHL